ncbi:DUF4256 domain-containing protein [Joostella sp. CR20]|uniref:DUF4256 domain-containing protein n=1 Tax=Joostella sp. CR20 TaxID=2804312 RepID=UPI00313AFB67
MQLLSPTASEAILKTLETRFLKDKDRFPALEWKDIELKFKNHPEKLWSVNEMEKTGGEPNLLSFDTATAVYIFCDFSKESPKERRSYCYDREALEARKKFKPSNNALDVATAMGIELMTENQYRQLQSVIPVDTKTSSWLQTPDEIRSLGGAIFGDCRYNTVFIYHNGADSYYAARGFRGILKL